MPSLTTTPITGATVTLAQLVGLRARAGHWRNFGRRHAASSGSRRGSRHGRGMEFEELRAYDAADDARDIDWRVTARTGQPHTKTYREERERPTTLVVDVRSSMAFGSRLRFKNVAAAELAAAIAWGALADADRVGGLLLADAELTEVPARRHDSTVLRLLGSIARATENALAGLGQSVLLGPTSGNAGGMTGRRGDSTTSPPSIGFDRALDAMTARARPGERIVLIGDFHDAPSLSNAPLAALARRVDLHCVLIYDPLDAELPPPGQYPLTLAHGGAVRWLDSAARRAREEHRQRFAARRQWLAGLARRAPVRLDELRVDVPIDTLAPRRTGSPSHPTSNPPS